MTTTLWFMAKYTFQLWVYFLAVMKLRDVRDAGNLQGPAKYPAYAVLVIGYALDALVNVVVITIAFGELPRLFRTPGISWPEVKQWEWTVSERTKRHAAQDTRRGAVSRYVRTNFLAIADDSGGHD